MGNFHPPYTDVIAEYNGTSSLADEAGDGGGLREAYFLALENTADATKHSVLRGKAPAGTVLRLKKTFQTPTWRQADGQPIYLTDTLETTMRVPSSGVFEWHVNPSTRPLVATARGRGATGAPSEQELFTGDAAGTITCGDVDSEVTTCWRDHAFTVPAGAGVDNAGARIRLEWPDSTSDWDMRVFEDSNGDGSSAGETEVAMSAQPFSDFEETDVAEPALVPGADYVVRVINFAATDSYEGSITYEGPEPSQDAMTESWDLTCELPQGTVRAERSITIGRGGLMTVYPCAPPVPKACTIAGSNGNNKLVGTRRRDVICGLGGNDTIKGLGGNDKLLGGGGNDTLTGSAGKDAHLGQGGDDLLLAKDGARDTVNGGPGRDAAKADRIDRKISIERLLSN